MHTTNTDHPAAADDLDPALIAHATPLIEAAGTDLTTVLQHLAAPAGGPHATPASLQAGWDLPELAALTPDTLPIDTDGTNQ
ncbi:hypothetical protein [uncultured Cellulomonas sp.]|uniref:hypothetical protein n=1 Tax=uncultured Cellulomonas sp. TaxID=189682 RepID=UPI00262842EA|nr:hypothetical protein [uncultured Cellulomonas sp.]